MLAARAEQVLAEHPSCERVTVWQDDRQVLEWPTSRPRSGDRRNSLNRDHPRLADPGARFRGEQRASWLCRGRHAMSTYRIFFLGLTGGIEMAHVFQCDTDDEACAEVERMRDIRPMELWNGSRAVARFDREGVRLRDPWPQSVETSTR